MPWRDELGQYSGNLHAGLMSALVDTACGFAPFTVSGHAVASHCAVNYLAPGSGSAFVATARTCRSGDGRSSSAPTCTASGTALPSSSPTERRS